VNSRLPSRTASRFSPHRGFSSGIFGVVLLFVLSIAGATWVSMGIVTTERWPIRWLELNGSFDRVSAEQLRASLAPLISSSFFSIDLHALHQVATKNPWIASASVQKRWPDSVVVTIEEHVPVAHWNSGQLISSRGQGFQAAEADEIQGLPWLNGPEEQMPAVLEHWTRFNNILDSAALEIAQLTLDPRGTWSLQLNKGTELQLGRENASERLERLMNSWETLMRGHDLPPVLIDLRYANGFAVQWPESAADFAGVDKR
jgi:cell division protein FtsQ